MSRRALVFPGQGAEDAEMGLALARVEPRARRLLALASEATKVDVPRAIERGGKALARTEVLQPALLAVSLGAAHALAARGVGIDVALGHSLGELAAACFALGVDDETAIALAVERGERMARAAEARPGGMVALPARIELPDGVVWAAHNADDEHVASGDELAIAALARTPGATRLRVAGPWHAPAMQPVVAPLRASLTVALASTTPRCVLLSAVTAAAVEHGEAASTLARGLTLPVRWSETLGALGSLGIESLVTAPPGRLSRALIRRNLGARSVVLVLETPADLASVSP